MMKKKIRNKRPTKSYTKKLLKKAMIICEREMKLAIHRRDRETCQVCGKRGVPMDVDHWISRVNMSTYFDVNNLTLLCKSCHVKKSFGRNDMAQKVTDIVFKREGISIMQEIRQKSYQIKKWNADELLAMAESYKKLWA